MVGNVGTKELFNYTAIGDVVNTAQRIEAVARPRQILLLHETYALVAEHVQVKPLDPVYVKGREEPVTVYELLGLQGESL